MNLDDLERFRELDPGQMRASIDALPEQFASAWQDAQALTPPESFGEITQLAICAIGTPAIAGDLVAILAAESCRNVVHVVRGDRLPAWVSGPHTLAVFFGNAPERATLATEAAGRGAQILHILPTGPQRTLSGALWTFPHGGPDRTALPAYLALLLALLVRLGWIADPTDPIRETVEILRSRVPVLGVESIAARNPAKRLAGQMIGRIPVIYGSGIMAPVARRWKAQLNENAKSWSQWEELPEADQNAASGIVFPSPLMTRVNVVFLMPPPFDPPLATERAELTHDLYLHEGIAVDKIKGRGHHPLAQAMSAIQYGDYVSFYVAMAYGIDPTPTPIAELNEFLTGHSDQTS